MELQFDEKAKYDVIEIVKWYEDINSELAGDFIDCLDEALQVISVNPFSRSIRYMKKARIIHIHRFPYAVHYFIFQNSVNVFGVFHASRNPKIWRKRLK